MVVFLSSQPGSGGFGTRALWKTHHERMLKDPFMLHSSQPGISGPKGSMAGQMQFGAAKKNASASGERSSTDHENHPER